MGRNEQIAAALTGKDPFTSDNARVYAPQINQAVRLVSACEELFSKDLQNQLGNGLWRVRCRAYFGLPVEWLGGFWSEYGFHIRGYGATPEECITKTVAGVLPDDPRYLAERGNHGSK